MMIVDGGKEVVPVEDALLVDVADADESEEGGVP